MICLEVKTFNKNILKNPNSHILEIVNNLEKGVEFLLNIHDLKEIMNLYTEPLIRLAYYYVKDRQAAEDIVQEVFIKDLSCSI